MDYQEAIEELKSLHRHCSDMINESEPDSVWRKDCKALDVAISAMQELQALHEQGFSLERLKDIDFRKDVIEHINYYAYMGLQEELEEYKQLGTLEEVREAVEKHKAKKATNIRGDKLKFCTCPSCEKRITNVEGGNYCQNCGQKLDWSEEE